MCAFMYAFKLCVSEGVCVCVCIVYLSTRLCHPLLTRKPKDVSLSIVFSEGIYLRSQHSSVCRSLCFVGADFSGGEAKHRKSCRAKRQALEETFRGRLWNEKDLIMSLCDGRQ